MKFQEKLLYSHIAFEELFDVNNPIHDKRLEALKVFVDEIENDVLKSGVVDFLRQAWSHRESPDLEFVKEKCLEFCKNQVIKSAIMESVEMLETQQYDEIKQIIEFGYTK